MFGATLNVGQRHRRRANINLALVQSIVPVPPACQYGQHEVLTRVEWILASKLLLNAAQQKPGVEPVWFDAGPASQTVGQHWTSIGSTSRACWEC